VPSAYPELRSLVLRGESVVVSRSWCGPLSLELRVRLSYLSTTRGGWTWLELELETGQCRTQVSAAPTAEGSRVEGQRAEVLWKSKSANPTQTKMSATLKTGHG
jgi:hypothetical protein